MRKCRKLILQTLTLCHESRDILNTTLAGICAAGYHGGGGCFQCSIGTAKNETGNGDCTPCQPGFFAAEPGQAECTPCPEHTYANSESSAECKDFYGTVLNDGTSCGMRDFIL